MDISGQWYAYDGEPELAKVCGIWHYRGDWICNFPISGFKIKGYTTNLKSEWNTSKCELEFYYV